MWQCFTTKIQLEIVMNGGCNSLTSAPSILCIHDEKVYMHVRMCVPKFVNER